MYTSSKAGTGISQILQAIENMLEDVIIFSNYKTCFKHETLPNYARVAFFSSVLLFFRADSCVLRNKFGGDIREMFKDQAEMFQPGGAMHPDTIKNKTYKVC